MSLRSNLRERRSLVFPVLWIALALTAILVFRGPLIRWFSGKALGGSEGQPVVSHAGPFTIEARLAPDPPREKDQGLILVIHDGAGKAVENAEVDVVYDMPSMGAMAEMKGGARVTPGGAGKYSAQFDLPMGSSWTLRATVHADSGSASQSFQMTVGTTGLALGGGSGHAATEDGGQGRPAATPSPGEIDHYTCSMHPSVKQAAPGTCPICGMDLVPVTKEQQQDGVVRIDDVRRQLIGVRTEKVIAAPMRHSFRAVGHVSYDESTLADVNLKVHGWITKLLVNETGQRVTRGQTLFTMYSPELFNAEQDFLLGRKGASANVPHGDFLGPERPELFARASRQRLHLLGLSDAQIDAIAQTGNASEEIAIPSPASGFVIEKNVVEGSSVDAGMRLYRIAALTKVWVEADVYEADLGQVRVGQHARVTLDYLKGRAYDATVAYLYPYLDPATRTGRVRLELSNKDLDLKPGMYASVELSADLGIRTQVPTAAVVYTGPRRLVFVDLGSGRFRPTEVAVGVEANGMVEVLSGLRAGDAVATSGVFLIAAEARITTAAKYWDSTPETADAALEPEADPTPMMPMTPAGARPRPMPGAAPAVPSAPRPQGAPWLDAGTSPGAADFTCPMHPDVHSPGPGKCPVCGMDLQPRNVQP